MYCLLGVWYKFKSLLITSSRETRLYLLIYIIHSPVLEPLLLNLNNFRDSILLLIY